MQVRLASRAGRCQGRRANDRFRLTLAGGRLIVSAGVCQLGPDAVGEAVYLVTHRPAAELGAAPHGAHEVGCFRVGGAWVGWRIARDGPPVTRIDGADAAERVLVLVGGDDP